MELKNTIFSLAEIMSVSGYTRYDGEKLLELTKDHFDEIIEDNLGGFIFVRRCGRANAAKILVDSHLDEIGMMITDILEGGFLTVTSIGGLDTRILEASEVTVYGKDPETGKTKRIFGIIGSMPSTLRKPDDASKLLAVGELIIDTGIDKKELEKYIRIGSAVGFAPIYTELKNGLIAGKGFDNKACAASALCAIANTRREDLAGDVYLLLSSFEETGLCGAETGAYRIAPDYALVADVNLAHTPDTKKTDTVEVGGGVSVTLCSVIDRGLTEMLLKAAKEKEIKTQLSVCSSRTGTNTTVIHTVGRGVPCIDVGLPLKSMHTSNEVISLDDAKSLEDIIKVFITDKEIAEVYRNVKR